MSGAIYSLMNPAKQEKHISQILESLKLDLDLDELFSAGEDLQESGEDSSTRACKDLQFFLRRPFCCK